MYQKLEFYQCSKCEAKFPTLKLITGHHCNPVIKEVQPNSLQQLKAEIAAKKKPERPYSSDYEEGCIDGYNDAIDDVLRQLSAV